MSHRFTGVTRMVAAWSLVLLAAAAGCSGGKSTLSGRVLYNGRAVLVGSIIVVGADGVAVVGRLDDNGEFTVGGIRPGEVRVGVSSPTPVQQAGFRRPGRGPAKPLIPPPPAPGWFPLPGHLADPGTSGVLLSLASGRNRMDIDLR